MPRNRVRRQKLRFLSNVVIDSFLKPMRGVAHRPRLARPDELGVTFIGHSSFLLQLAGLSILVDPVFANYLYVLKRRRKPGLRLRELPPIDAVLLTHAHMDHLNFPSLRRIIRHTQRLRGVSPAVVVPSGVEDLVARLGFSRIVSLGWWQNTDLRSLTGSESGRNSGGKSEQGLDGDAGRGSVHVTMTPAQHWGARLFSDTHRGYGGYALSGAGHRVYHSGDTAYFEGFSEIGRRLQPQVALLPIGAYSPDNFRGVHTSPEDALRGFLDLGAETMIPMHYGTFRLSMEPMDEPVPRLLAAAANAGVGAKMLPLTEGRTHIFPPRK